ncbi:hypothetical protein [Aureimonas sp. D3]|uniref:hypothetical protein n=1 Tax=Aureimonas sp. D3 TaxID=1638164 RepID=UPI000784C593|nr:hypothetical protein [Aureimonas sp. D3]
MARTPARINAAKRSLAGAIGSGVLLPGGGKPRLVNTVMGGLICNNVLPTAGSKTRFKGRRAYQFGLMAPPSIQPTFCPWWTNGTFAQREVAAAQDITISKAAVVYNGVSVPVTYNGSRTFVIPAGVAEFMCDPILPTAFGVSWFAPRSFVEYRHLFDLVSGQSAPYCDYSTDFNQSWRGVPSDLGDDVDATGSMTVTNTPDALHIFFPSMMLGPVSGVFASLGLIGDSLLRQQNDTGGLGRAGGSYFKRAAYAEGVPFVAMAVGGRTAEQTANSPKFMSLLEAGRFTDVHIGLGTNELIGSRDLSLIMADNRAIWASARKGGVRTIIQSNIQPRVADNAYKCTDLANQVPVAGFEAGGRRDQFNAALAAERGVNGGPDIIFDFASFCADASNPSLWRVLAFSGTLTADVASGATSIQTSAPPVYGDNLVFEPGNSSNVDIGGQGGPRVASVSGSAAPYTVSFVPTTTNPWNGAADGALGTPGKAHVTGSAVKATIGTDGTHAAMSAHMGAAVPLRTIYQKLAGDASAQRNIISGSVRTKLPISQGAAIASAQKYVARVRHKANSYVDEPFFEYFHGQMISSGGVGFNLQRGFLNSDRVVNSVAVSGTTMTLTMETTRGYRTGDVVTVRNNGADYASGAITIASDTTATLTVANGTAAPGGTVVCRNPFYRIERRAALVTGIAGVAQDQSAAVLTKMTWFGMVMDYPFMRAGGAVSADGFTLTVPNGFAYRTDRVASFRLAAGRYYIQEEYRAFGTGDIIRPTGLYGRGTDFGEYGLGLPTDTANDLVFAKNWSGAGTAALTAAASGPCAVLGTGPEGVKCVLVDGDSNICEAALSSRTNGVDTGDDDDCLGPVKRALNMKGYSFIDVSLSGSNIGNQFAGYDAGPSALRRVFRQYCDGVITNHAGNDRRSGITFENVGAAPGSLNDASGNGLRVLTSWHNSDLRATLRGPKRIVRTTLLPATTSTDGYATTANQTGKNDDAVWVSDYATSANGDQFKLADLNMRRGAYATLPYGGAGECDAGWDMYAASGHTADGKFAPLSTNDGTHQFVANIVAAANDLAPRLPALLGFAA